MNSNRVKFKFDPAYSSVDEWMDDMHRKGFGVVQVDTYQGIVDFPIKTPADQICKGFNKLEK